MAQKDTRISSGIYFTETDLTFIQQNVGTFAGGAIVLSEKGPAFEVMTSSSMADRITRLGNLNPDYKASYYANEFLNQASNYKGVRMLGLEGHNEDPFSITEGAPNICGVNKMFVVAYDIPNVSSQQPAQTPERVIGTTSSEI